MAQETASPHPSTNGSEHDSLARQMSDLRRDIAGLTRSVASIAGSNGQSLAHDVSDGMAEAARYVGRKGHDVDLRIESAVAANPYMALALAAGVGLILGSISRR